jgi:uncharacterized protein (TIGR01777 family)
MKIVLTGASGFIGKRLIEKLASARHDIVLLSRNPSSVNVSTWNTVQVKQWDGKTLGEWAADVDGADAVMNFAGEPMAAKRWFAAQKERIINSRVDATRAIVAAIAQATRKPSVLINASAVGYYGSVENDEVTEAYKRGDGFLPIVCDKWESEARTAENFGVRVVMLRMSVIVAEGGGALARMMLPFKMFVGGPVGSGKQWFPWVHRDDVVDIALFALENSRLSGPVNVAAPESVTMRQFCDALGKAMHRPSWAAVPSFVLRLAFGEMAEMLLTGQRVVPSKLTLNGYAFRFPKLDDALADIFS